MAFLTGSITFLRFSVSGGRPEIFDSEILDRLREYAAGRQRLASADGIEVGWAASKHVLDTDFGLEKNICNDALLFDLRVDTEKLPADILKAYFEIELKALLAGNPSGFPSARQRREAREAARDRLEDEAKDGRYKKRKCIPVMWDRQTNELLFGATSVAHVDRLCALFKNTFGRELTPITAGREESKSIKISELVVGVTPESVAWIADDASSDHLGNEFLVWLWFNTEGESDTVELTDHTDATYMISRRLVLDCPRGTSGTDGFKHEGPSKLPEAKRALRSGKLPRQCGLILVRQDEQYEFTLNAETLGIGTAKMPKVSDDVTNSTERAVERINQIRHFIQSLDLLYEKFLETRLGPAWSETLGRIRKWLSAPERRESA